MQRIHLTYEKQVTIIPGFDMKATIKWITNVDDHAIVQVRSDIGFNCMLHISPGIHGSIFEIRYKHKRLTLAIDEVIMKNNEVDELVFLLE